MTPSSLPEQHGLYVDELSAAVKNERLQNIALTGRYGSGKSSVLEAFATLPENRKRTLTLALSTLGAATDSEARESITNRIEKELVKQLLHREKPSRLPQSRYRRIRALSWSTAIWQSALLCTAILCLLWTLGWMPDLPQVEERAGNPATWIAAVVSAGVVVWSLAWTRIAVRGRFRLAGLSAGGASVSLAETSNSYFDKYLDEIVYFFEAVPEVEIVIFEDLDRFDDPGIFEALRELNTLINTSKQTEGRTIRFVYALRDSIFERLGDGADASEGDAASVEAVRANRTKFFDLVIPIVPFITHRNARDHLVRLIDRQRFSEQSRPSLAVVDLVAKHLPDMRLLTNVVNEYAVFSRRLIDEEGGVVGLPADPLFAMLVFKSIHLSDFEKIQLGKSSLDETYAVSRDLISSSLTATRAELARISRAAALVDRLETRFVLFAKTLDWYLAQRQHQSYPFTTLRIGEQSFEMAQTGRPEFWEALLASTEGLTAHDRQQRASVSLSRADLQTLLGQRIDFEAWERAVRDSVAKDRQRLERDLDEIRHADFKTLVAREDLEVEYDGEHLTFRDVVARLSGSEIQGALIEGGYIDANFALYVSQYYGERVPPNAMNFLLQHVERDRPDANYAFAEDEIAAVIREAPEGFLSGRVARNTEIVDFLASGLLDEGSHPVLDELMRDPGVAESEFLDTYLGAGEKRSDVVAYLAPSWPEVFLAITENEALGEEVRRDLFEVALVHSSVSTTYGITDEALDFLELNYRSMSSLTGGVDGAFNDPQKSNAANTAARLGWRSMDLAALNQAARQRVIGFGAFEISTSNLLTVTAGGSLALDAIQSTCPEAYDVVVRRPTEYLEAIEGADPAGALETTQKTIDDPAAAAGVLGDLQSADQAVVESILRRASERCVLQELRSLAEPLWAPIVATGRVAMTASNVRAYLGVSDELDQALAEVLRSNSYEIEDDLEQADAFVDSNGDEEPIDATRRLIASAVLRSVSVVPGVDDRCRSVASLDLDERLDPALVPAERGQLLGSLLEWSLVDSDSEIVNRFAPLDWETLQAALASAPEISHLVSPDLLSEKCLADLLGSRSDAARDMIRSIFERFEEFIPDGEDRALFRAAGQAALHFRLELTAEQIATVAAGSKDGGLIVELIAIRAADLAGAEILQLLCRVDEQPYSRLPGLQVKQRIDFVRNDASDLVIGKLHQVDGLVVRRIGKSRFKPSRIRVTREQVSATPTT